MKLEGISLKDAIIIVRSSIVPGFMSARLCKKGEVKEGESLYITNIKGSGMDVYSALGDLLYNCNCEGNDQIDEFMLKQKEVDTRADMGSHFIASTWREERPHFVDLYINPEEAWKD